MDVYDKSLVTMLACTTIFFVLAIPLIARKVPRNRIYGFRTRTTLSAETLWLEVNAYFGRRLLVASVFSALGVIGALLHVSRAGMVYLQRSRCAHDACACRRPGHFSIHPPHPKKYERSARRETLLTEMGASLSVKASLPSENELCLQSRRGWHRLASPIVSR
jgi:hypothetical protein